MSHEPNGQQDSQLSTSQNTIRKWADEHDATPVRRTEMAGEGVDLYLVQEADVEETHERVEWDVFFDEMDERDYVVRYYGSEGAEPFHVMGREEAIAQSGIDRERIEEGLLEGETVESVITETTTVESVIVEEATVESELVGTEVIDQRVVEVEPVSRESLNCTLVDDQAADHDDWFDTDRYLASAATHADADTSTAHAGADTSGMDAETGADTAEMDDTAGTDMDADTSDTGVDAHTAEQEFPYHVELEVEERWLVTRELLERFTVESRIADSDITETDTIEDHDIDVSGLHQTIAEMGLLESGLSPDEVMTHYDIETEIATDDHIHTHFDRERLIEEEVIDRKRLTAEIAEAELLEMEIVHSEDLAVEIPGVEGGGADGAMSASTDEAGETGAMDEMGEAGAPGDAEATRVSLSDDEIGKTVIDANGEEIGMVTNVEPDNDLIAVDAHPGIADRIRAALDWGNTDDDAYPVRANQIERITDDEIQLKHSEELDENDEMR